VPYIPLDQVNKNNVQHLTLDAGSGKQIWEFNPEHDEGFNLHVNRGVNYWEGGNDKRIFFTAGSKVLCLHLNT